VFLASTVSNVQTSGITNEDSDALTTTLVRGSVLAELLVLQVRSRDTHFLLKLTLSGLQGLLTPVRTPLGDTPNLLRVTSPVTRAASMTKEHLKLTLVRVTVEEDAVGMTHDFFSLSLSSNSSISSIARAREIFLCVSNE
jgi:hypothetical protein